MKIVTLVIEPKLYAYYDAYVHTDCAYFAYVITKTTLIIEPNCVTDER